MAQDTEQFTTEISAEELGKQLLSALAQVSIEGERLVVRLNGMPSVAIVKLDDLDALEAFEDAMDRRAAAVAIEEMRQDGGKTYSLEEVRRELGDIE